MQQVTIRGLDQDVERVIRKIASDNGKSMNQVIKEIIHKEFEKSRRPASSLSEMAGGWSRPEAAEFEAAIQSCEQIDEDLWK